MYQPFTIDPNNNTDGPFVAVQIDATDGSGTVVLRKSTMDDEFSELYFVPSTFDHSELICKYMVELLNQLALEFPEVESLQAYEL